MKMATAMPDVASQRNGLNDLVRMLADEKRDDQVICVAVVDASQVLVDKVKHSRTPTIRVLHLEPMLSRDEQDQAVALLTDAYKRRTSEQLELEYEFEPIQRDAPGFYPQAV
jgi:hypothetical protein